MGAPVTSGPTVEAWASLTADTNADFGAVALNSTTTRTFTLRNSGAKEATGVSVAVPSGVYLSLSSNTCGTVAQPVNLARGASCSVSVQWTPAAASGLAGAALTTTGWPGGVTSVALSGSAGGFNVTGAWSKSGSPTVMPTEADRTFSTTTLNAYQEKTFFLRNVGTYGSLSSGVRLSGDSAHFRITGFGLAADYGPTINLNTQIVNGGQATNAVSAANISGGNDKHIFVTVRYQPTQIGSHSVSLSSFAINGGVMPEPLTILGSGQYNPTGAWSSQANSTVAFSGTALNVGPITAGAGGYQDKNVYLRSVGTHGGLSASFALSGDTSQFKIVSVGMAANYSNGPTIAQNAKINAGGLSTQPVTATDPYTNGLDQHLYLTVRYTPTEPGPHTVTVTTTGNAGSSVPSESVTLQGLSYFDAQGIWSTAPNSTIAMTDAFKTYGPLASVGAYTDKTFYLRSVGTYGRLNAGYTLTGDTAHFKIVGFGLAANYSGSPTIAQNAKINAGGLSTQATSGADPSGGGLDRHVYVTVRYQPTSSGAHSIALTPFTENNSTLPAGLSLTGSVN